jgi:hypothetical protein
MSPFGTLSSLVALNLAVSSFTQAAVITTRDDTPAAPCTPFGPADEIYYKLSGHSSPLYGVQIDIQSGLLTAVTGRDTNVQFQFEKCDAPSTGYIQGEPITEGYAPEYFGHVRHVESGKCLRQRDATLDFELGDCPSVDVADVQLPFWFESPAENGVVRFTGYQNTTAYPKPEWFATQLDAPPFAIVTNTDGANGTANQWVLARPIRT